MGINYKELEAINNHAQKNNVKLLIVTKKRSLKDIEELIRLGYRNFGENKVQEADLKFSKLISSNKVNLSLIGPLQTNKAKVALKIFDTIQTIDRKKLVDEIIKFHGQNAKTKNFFIQINIGNEEQKSGVHEKDLSYLYEYCVNNGLFIEGLMCIPPNIENPSIYFDRMNFLKNNLNPDLKLSMGMSTDYKIAIKHKSNLIRVGSLIFNE